MRESTNEVAHEQSFAVIDVETTGLNPKHEHIIEIGVILLNSMLETEREWSTLINPCRSVTASHIHGIYDSDLIGAPVFAEIAQELRELLHGRIFVAHNAPFDQAFINREFARMNTNHSVQTNNIVKTNNTVCTMDQSRIYCAPGSHALIKLAQRLGLAHEQEHRGLSDARICADLLRYFVACEKQGKRYTNEALNRAGQPVFPAQWRTATPMHM